MALDGYRSELKALEDIARYRALTPRAGLDFTSNDYLGLAAHPAIRTRLMEALAAGMEAGAGGSRLLRGNHPAHESLEAAAAAFFNAPRALFMGTGYLANFALFTTLPKRGDLIVFDDLMHASVKEGLHASHARRIKAAHNDVDAFDDALSRWRKNGGTGQAWISVESVYSMDGDRAPLADLVQVADKHDAWLVIDEAHATGVHGPGGRGLSAELEGRENVIQLHTCGKALGAAGALISASGTVIDYLINRCRPFIYSTAPSPLMAVAVEEALRIVEAEPGRAQRLAALYGKMNDAVAGLFGSPAGTSQIVPVVLGSDSKAVLWAEALQERGFDVRAIRPPTVPEGTARLRIAVTLNVGEADVEALIAALRDLFESAPP